eukprot:349907-Chlamydomonas_euryale.AAC.3
MASVSAPPHASNGVSLSSTPSLQWRKSQLHPMSPMASVSAPPDVCPKNCLATYSLNLRVYGMYTKRTFCWGSQCHTRHISSQVSCSTKRHNIRMHTGVAQVLYFDRYTRILAPQLQVFTDERVNIRGLNPRARPMY